MQLNDHKNTCLLVILSVFYNVHTVCMLPHLDYNRVPDIFFAMLGAQIRDKTHRYHRFRNLIVIFPRNIFQRSYWICVLFLPCTHSSLNILYVYKKLKFLRANSFILSFVSSCCVSNTKNRIGGNLIIVRIVIDHRVSIVVSRHPKVDLSKKIYTHIISKSIVIS